MTCATCKVEFDSIPDIVYGNEIHSLNCSGCNLKLIEKFNSDEGEGFRKNFFEYAKSL